MGQVLVTALVEQVPLRVRQPPFCGRCALTSLQLISKLVMRLM